MLQARKLTRRSRDGQLLLDGVSWEITAGQRWGLTGPTGSGKTLLLRALALLDPLDSGEILWQKNPVADADVPAFRRRVIYLQQQPALIEGIVEDNLRLPFAFKVNCDLCFDRDRCLTLLAKLELNESFLQKNTADLSGGESQVTSLLRAMQLQPSILLLDEPTAALDGSSTELVERLIDSWFNEAKGERAFVWVTHDELQSGRVADRRLTLRLGRLVEGDDSNG